MKLQIVVQTVTIVLTVLKSSVNTLSSFKLVGILSQSTVAMHIGNSFVCQINAYF